jgi:hypothetical protein
VKFAVTAVLAAFLVLASQRSARADDPPSFVKDIKPLLTKYCVQCHNSKQSKAGVNLESYETIMRGGKNNKVLLTASEPDKSRLVLVIESKQRPAMPPMKAKQPSADEKKLLRTWVAAGAQDDTPKAETSLPRFELNWQFADLRLAVGVVEDKRTR